MSLFRAASFMRTRCAVSRASMRPCALGVRSGCAAVGPSTVLPSVRVSAATTGAGAGAVRSMATTAAAAGAGGKAADALYGSAAGAGPAASFKGKASGQLTSADIRKKSGFIIDMDGVIYHGKRLLDGAASLVQWLKQEKKKFLFLTNSAERTPRELQEKLARLGLDVTADHFYSSALATALFLSRQCPGGSAYVIGEPGLTAALYDVGYSMNDTNPDYVVVGETRNYNYEKIETAVHLLRKGARLIGTNCDLADRMEDSFVPACGSLITPLSLSSGKTPYFIGKPNPLIMRSALDKLGVHRREAVIIGDRMDTDILAGVQSEISTVLVLSGVTNRADVSSFAFRPDLILPSVAHIPTDTPTPSAKH